jgi:hypothetical protein
MLINKPLNRNIAGFFPVVESEDAQTLEHCTQTIKKVSKMVINLWKDTYLARLTLLWVNKYSF